MTRTRGRGAALTAIGLMLGCLAAAGCDRSAPAPPLQMRAARYARSGSPGQQAFVAADVRELRDGHGRVTVVVELRPGGSLGSFSIGHYDLSCALARLRMADARGNAVGISDPVLTVGASAGSPGYTRVPSQGLLLAVELLDDRRVVTATRVRGVMASPADGCELAYELRAAVRVAGDGLDGSVEVPMRGAGKLIYRRQ